MARIEADLGKLAARLTRRALGASSWGEPLKKRVGLIIGLGCLAVALLCAFSVFRGPFFSASISVARERKSHPQLDVQMIADLGSATGVYYRPDGERILVRGELRYHESTTKEFAVYRLYDKQGNLIVSLGEAQWGYITSSGIVLVAMSGSNPVGNLCISTAPWKLSFWSWDGKLIKDEEGYCCSFPKLIFNPDLSKFVTFTAAKEEQLWSSDGQRIATLTSPNGEEIEGVSFSSDGRLIATSAQTATWLWDENGNLLHTLSLPDDRHVSAKVYFSPDGRQLAVANFDHSEIWTTGGQLITILENVDVIAYSPDSRYVTGIQSAGLFALFDIHNGFAPKSLITYDSLPDLRFSMDGQHFITFGCTDGQYWESGFYCYGGRATLWDVDGNLISDLKGLAEVTQADFVPNSNKIMTAGCDGIIEYSRDIPSYDCLSHSLRLHDYSGNTIAILTDEVGDFWISPDGKSFVTATPRYGGNAKLWGFLP